MKRFNPKTMKTNNKSYQQGDVLLSPICLAPQGCKQIKDKRGVVLAEGGHTGHYHAFEDDDGGVALLEAPDRSRYLVISGGRKAATLTHQEHKPIAVPPGTYRIGIVREKDWFTEMVRNVVD